MSDLKLKITGIDIFSIMKDDRILTHKGKGVSTFIAKVDGGSAALDNLLIVSSYMRHTFPVLGKSLPCAFPVTYINGATYLYIAIEEYGAIADPDYFNITDLDKDGLPIYAEASLEGKSIQVYKKPIVNGDTFGDRVLLKTVDNTPENRLLYKIRSL